jgi:hypothetical protein
MRIASRRQPVKNEGTATKVNRRVIQSRAIPGSLSRNSQPAFINHNHNWLSTAGTRDTAQGSAYVPLASFRASSTLKDYGKESGYLWISCVSGESPGAVTGKR